MDNNEVYALFEDIRNGLKGINDRLENAPKASAADESHADQVRGGGG